MFFESQYFDLGIFFFNSYVYYLTRGFIASTCAFNLLTRAFSLPTRAFNLATRAFVLLTREFDPVTRRFELVTRVLLFHIYRPLKKFFAGSSTYCFKNDDIHSLNDKLMFPVINPATVNFGNDLILFISAFIE